MKLKQLKELGISCCADCIEDIAKEVGFSFASGDGGAEWTV